MQFLLRIQDFYYLKQLLLLQRCMVTVIINIVLMIRTLETMIPCYITAMMSGYSNYYSCTHDTLETMIHRCCYYNN